MAGRIAAIDPKLSLSARMVEIARLRDEQEAALVRLRQDIAAERRVALRGAISGLSAGYRRARIALAQRQQTERAGLRQIRPDSSPRTATELRPSWTSVRAFAVRVLPHTESRQTRPMMRK